MTKLPEKFEFKTPSKSMTVSPNDFGMKALKYGGIYVFYDNYGGCLYVGQSHNLRTRLMNHIATSPFKRRIEYADLYFLDPYYREIFETIFINYLKPQFNLAKVFAMSDEESVDVSEEIAQLEYEAELLREELAELEGDARFDDVSETYGHYTDGDEVISHMLGVNLIAAERIPDLERQIKRKNNEIQRLQRKLS